MMVTFCDSSACVLGSSGLTNAYRSVLSAAGSWLISGASRWLEALAASGPEPRTSATVTAAASPRTTRKARAFLCIPSPSLGLSRRIRTMGQFGSANRNEAARECPRMAVLALSAPSARRRASMARDLAHLSDEALVALAARMDDLALAELYDRFGHAAYGLALRIVRDPALAEDAVQEAFLTLWRSASRFVPERAKASTWILTLVHRRAVDIVRREQPRRTVSRWGPSRAECSRDWPASASFSTTRDTSTHHGTNRNSRAERRLRAGCARRRRTSRVRGAPHALPRVSRHRCVLPGGRLRSCVPGGDAAASAGSPDPHPRAGATRARKRRPAAPTLGPPRSRDGRRGSRVGGNRARDLGGEPAR